MHLDIQARGFSLTDGLRSAIGTEAYAYADRFPQLQISLQVRLFDVNAQRGGIDKGCLLSAHIGRSRKVIVASDLDADLYRAIPGTFAKLARATRFALRREHTRHYDTHVYTS